MMPRISVLRRKCWLCGVFAMSALVHAAGPVPPLQSTKSCTSRDFIGTFGFFGTGNVVQSSGPTPVGPFARVGTFSADGNGNLRFNSTANFNGLVAPFDFLGNYTMNSDCTFSATLHLTFPVRFDVTFIGVLADNGNESRELFHDPPGIVISANGKRQNLSDCTNRDLSGSFQFELSGTTRTDTGRLPFAALGKLDADGSGSLTGKLRSNFGGLSVQEDISGSYTVMSDCTFEMKYYTAGEERGPNDGVKLKGSLFDRGNGAFLMVLDPASAVVLGSLTRL
jgi:hypothetical protein